MALSQSTFKHDAQPVDPFELAFAQTVASQVFIKSNVFAGGVKNDPFLGPRFAESYQQVLLKLKDTFNELPGDKFASLCWRLLSLYKLVQCGALEEWVKPQELSVGSALPPNILFVAATLPLKDPQGFDPRQFVRNVRECISIDLYR